MRSLDLNLDLNLNLDLDLDLDLNLDLDLEVLLAVPRVVGENILGVFLAVPTVVGKNILEVFLILGATGHGCSAEGSDAAPRAHGTGALQASQTYVRTTARSRPSVSPKVETQRGVWRGREPPPATTDGRKFNVANYVI